METKTKQAKFSSEQVNNILATLKKMPKVEKKPNLDYLNKQATIKMLSAEIQAMQKRGYELKDIAETLNGHGIDITTPTLKSYLQRNKVAKVAKKETKVNNTKEQQTAQNIQTQARRPPPMENKGSFFIKPDRDNL